MRKYVLILSVGVGLASLSVTALGQEDAASEETLEAKVVDKQLAPGSASGFVDTVCTNGTNRRLVGLVKSQGCEVHYKKETEQPGHDQILWKARSDVAYCETKAAMLVDKLTSWGWSCAPS